MTGTNAETDLACDVSTIAHVSLMVAQSLFQLMGEPLCKLLIRLAMAHHAVLILAPVVIPCTRLCSTHPLKSFSYASCVAAGSKYEYSTLASCSKWATLAGCVGSRRVESSLAYLATRYRQIARDSKTIRSPSCRAGILPKGWSFAIYCLSYERVL